MKYHIFNIDMFHIILGKLWVTYIYRTERKKVETYSNNTQKWILIDVIGYTHPTDCGGDGVRISRLGLGKGQEN